MHTWSDPTRSWRHKHVTWRSAHGLHSFYITFSFQAFNKWFYEEICTISRQEKRRLRPGVQMVLHNLKAAPESGELQHYRSFLRSLWSTVVKRNSLSAQNLEKCTWLFTLLGSQCCNSLNLNVQKKKKKGEVICMSSEFSPQGNLSRIRF